LYFEPRSDLPVFHSFDLQPHKRPPYRFAFDVHSEAPRARRLDNIRAYPSMISKVQNVVASFVLRDTFNLSTHRLLRNAVVEALDLKAKY
jgi:hypothetical protein